MRDKGASVCPGVSSGAICAALALASVPHIAVAAVPGEPPSSSVPPGPRSLPAATLAPTWTVRVGLPVLGGLVSSESAGYAFLGSLSLSARLRNLFEGEVGGAYAWTSCSGGPAGTLRIGVAPQFTGGATGGLRLPILATFELGSTQRWSGGGECKPDPDFFGSAFQLVGISTGIEAVGIYDVRLLFTPGYLWFKKVENSLPNVSTHGLALGFSFQIGFVFPPRGRPKPSGSWNPRSSSPLATETHGVP